MIRTHAIIVLLACTAIAGCNRSIGSIAPTAPPRALPSNPAKPVTSAQLAPLDVTGVGQPIATQPPASPDSTAQPAVQPAQTPVQVAAVQDETAPPQTGEPITREGMAGSWQVPTDNPDCRIILAFTQWSGGYRAATRRCQSPEIQAVNAWDVKNLQVVLVDGAGNTVARLYASGGGRYDGRTTGGQPISFIR